MSPVEQGHGAPSVSADGAAPRGEWPDLRADIALLASGERADRPARVAIASYEFVGVVRNGGIGTACTELALALAGEGHEVDLFFTGWLDDAGGEEFARWVSHYGERGVRLERLEMARVHACDTVMHNNLHSLALYRMLADRERERPYDAIHFVESLGHGYYSLLAKRHGLAFAETTMVVGTHSPRRWLAEAHGDPFDHPIEIADEFLEERCLELADVVVSPSAHMLDWMRERGYELPRRSYVQQYVTDFEPVDPSASSGTLEELVFFGRLEARKGINTFCDALDVLAESGEVDAALKQVTFLGKESVPAVVLLDRAKKWPWKTRVISDYDRDAALAFLKEPGRLAVMASTMDNSPNAVYEAIGLGIAFLASRGGGTGELVAREDFERVTYDPCDPERRKVDPSDPTRTQAEHTGRVLAAKLAEALGTPPRPARFAVPPVENRETHLAWHRAIAAAPAPGEEGRSGGETGTTPRLARATIGSLPDLAALEAELLLVLDDTVQVDDRLEERLLAAAAGRPDVPLFTALGSFDRVEPDRTETYTFVPSGGPGAVAVLGNCAGAGAALVRRSAWGRLGLLGDEDRRPRSVTELLARAALADERIDVVPESLYRVPESSFVGDLMTTAQEPGEMLRPFYMELPRASRDIATAAVRIFREEHGLRGAARESAEQLAAITSSRSLRMTAPLRTAGTRARLVKDRARSIKLRLQGRQRPQGSPVRRRDRVGWPAMANDLDIGALFPDLGDELGKYAGMLKGEVLNAGAGDRDLRPLIPGNVHNQDIAEGLHSADIDIVAPLHEIPVADGFFDGIVCNAVLEHVANPEEVLAEFARVTKPGAILYLCVPFMQPEHLDPTDFQRYTIDGLQLLVERHGFDVRDAEGIHNVYVTLGWIMREWLMATNRLHFRIARRLLFPWLARKAKTSPLYVRSLASAYRVVAVRRAA